MAGMYVSITRIYPINGVLWKGDVQIAELHRETSVNGKMTDGYKKKSQ